MFVSVILDPESAESANELSQILSQFGFKKAQRACWEHTTLNDAQLADVKRSIDRVTNYYDAVRIYQFPVEDGMFAVSEMKQKKWRRGLFKAEG